MHKIFIVTAYEYKKVVVTWTFVAATILAPLFFLFLLILPLLLNSGVTESTRLVIIDRQGDLIAKLKNTLTAGKSVNNDAVGNASSTPLEQSKNGAQFLGKRFTFKDFDLSGKTPEQFRTEMNRLITQNEIDAFLIIPENIHSANENFELHTRNPNDFVLNSVIENAVNKIVHSERFAKLGITETQLSSVYQKVPVTILGINQPGKPSAGPDGLRIGVFIGILMFISLTLYGTVVMGAVVAEKESRLAEVLFSSGRPFDLLFGKLIGVGLAGLTQLAIWVLSLIGSIAFGLISSGLLVSFPIVRFSTVLYFFVFFLLGFFTYATIYALIGSIVPTLQEGNNFALLPILLLLIVFYAIFSVVIDPGSTFSFWVSIAPFSSPLIMIVRIVTDSPPFWQIALAIGLNLLTIVGLTWVVARIYRVGMLMSGKRPTIPEIWHWICQTET